MFLTFFAFIISRMENECEYIDECRNRDNSLKCDKCENNPLNWEKMQKDGYDGEAHDRHNRKFYIYQDNYDPL